MTYRSPSPYARPQPGLRVKQGVPAVHIPAEEEAAAFPAEARSLLDEVERAQKPLLEERARRLEPLRERHFIVAGGTGAGLGGCVASALFSLLGEKGSLTIVSRDLSQSVAYETGLAMGERAARRGFGGRFQWNNYGVALSGRKLTRTVEALRKAGADRVIYLNAVAAAHSGILPGYPPVFVKDVDDEGLFQWQLPPLIDRQIKATKFQMGIAAVQFPRELENAGITVEITCFADWRGSLDHSSRYPSSIDYGRQGAYSTSLYLPKDIIQKAASEAYGSRRAVIDFFLPVMKTRALGMVPGGMVMSRLFDTLMEREGVRPVGTPELAVEMLGIIADAVTKGVENPFPRLDGHEAPLDPWFGEVVIRLNDDEESDFYWKRWINC